MQNLWRLRLYTPKWLYRLLLPDSIEDLSLHLDSTIEINASRLSVMPNLKKLFIFASFPPNPAGKLLGIVENVGSKLNTLSLRLKRLGPEVMPLTQGLLQGPFESGQLGNLESVTLELTQGLNDEALVAISRHSPQLNSCTISDNAEITDEGIIDFTNRLRHIERLRLWACPRVHDKTIQRLLDRGIDAFSSIYPMS